MAHVEDRWEKLVDGERVRTARYGQGDRWRARYLDPSGRERNRAFTRKLDAERFLATVEVDKLRGAFIDPSLGKVTLKTFAETRWLPALVHVRPNTLDLYTNHLNKHVLPAFGGRELRHIRRGDMRPFVASLSSTLKPSTVGTVYAVLRMVMQAAVDDELIAANPCSRVPLPQVQARVLEPLPAASVLLLAEKITKRYGVTVWLGAGAGLREGEALGLTVPRTDFLRRRLNIDEQMQRGQLSPLKTKASRRVVPIDDIVLNALTEHLKKWPSEHLVVTNRSGRPVGRGSFQHCWREAVEAAGLPEGTRFHDLRHFYASTLIAANLHPKTIQSRLGHATMAETMDTYGHLFPDAEEHGRGVLDQALHPQSTEPTKEATS